jgi:hypothetical protein
VFLSTKFLAGAWVVVLAVPLMMWLFSDTESYYEKVASELRLGKTPGIPHGRESVVIVPTSTVNLLTERGLNAALSIGDTVVALAVAGNEEERERLKQDWDQWKCSVPLEVVIDAHRSLVHSVLDYIEAIPKDQVTITVLIPEIIPTKRRRELLHNQRGRLLEAALKSRTDVVVATLPFHVRA